MKLNTNELQELNYNINKCKKVIDSCTNKIQIENAENYYSLLNIKYWNLINSKGYTALFSEDAHLIRKEFNKIHKLIINKRKDIAITY